MIYLKYLFIGPALLALSLGLRSSTLGERLSGTSGAGSSKVNKLPHWLQDAFSVPEKEAPEKAKDGRGTLIRQLK